MEKEEKYLVSLNKNKCTGCSGCYNACPKKAISMVEDEEGFLYPKIDKSKCINCHVCEKVCPVGAEKEELSNFEHKSYYYITSNESDLLQASSGGAFGDIIKSFFEEKNTLVYGCIMDENNIARHVGYDKIEDMEKFKKSKYVQSNLLNIYNEIKSNLKNGKKVLFSGTPCQVSGLKSFLNLKYDNLFCVDIICHGVPSQKLLNYYIETEEKKNKSKVKYLNFREKVIDKSGKYDSKNIKLIFENGKCIIKSVKESSYLFGFQNRLFYRPSCYKCNFCKINRDSDITIADCWGFEKINDKYDFHKGVSCVIVNSKKGESLLEKMTGEKNEIPLEFVINNNRCYTKATEFNKNRDKFFINLNSSNFNYRTFKYSRLPFFKRVKSKCTRVVKKIFGMEK